MTWVRSDSSWAALRSCDCFLHWRGYLLAKMLVIWSIIDNVPNLPWPDDCSDVVCVANCGAAGVGQVGAEGQRAQLAVGALRTQSTALVVWSLGDPGDPGWRVRDGRMRRGEVCHLRLRGRCTCGLLINGACRKSGRCRSHSRRRCAGRLLCTPWRSSESFWEPWC